MIFPERKREHKILPSLSAKNDVGSETFLGTQFWLLGWVVAIPLVSRTIRGTNLINKAGYKATEIAQGWAGAIFEVFRPFGQEK